MKTQIAFALSLLLVVGCSKKNNDIEPQTPEAGVDYFKFQYGSEWTLIEAQPNVVQAPPIDCDPKMITAVKSVSMSKKIGQGLTQTVGFEFIGPFSVMKMGNYSLSFSRNDALCGIELTLQQPKETGYVTLKTTNTIQSNDSYFKITDIISQKNTERISGEFVATLNNGEKIKGSFRMTVPKPTIN